MCGILGAFNYKVDNNIFDKCLDRLSHRGPDGRGTWHSDDYRCMLGHRRLSIIDLSQNGKQPMSTLDGRYTITYNGEIYNYLEIKTELVKFGYSFHSDCDTEVILNAYDAWGEEALNKFNGMWAFAIFDNLKKSLFASRDRFGVKPFFYSTRVKDKTSLAENGIVFASEMKAIIPLISSVTPDIGLVTNPNSIMLYENTKSTLIKEIETLPAGHSMSVSADGTITIKKYWDTLQNIPIVSGNYAEQCDYFRYLFLDACRLRMRSDVTLGTALSGGLDSSATLCGMAEVAKMSDDSINKDCHHAYVASLPGTSLDETSYANAVTDYLGMEGTDVVINPMTGMSRMPDSIYNFEEVYYTSPVPMMQTYAAMRRDGVYVTVDGHGADELFGGYSFDTIYSLLDVRPFSSDSRKLNEELRLMHIGNPGYKDKITAYKTYLDFVARHYSRIIFGKNHNSDDFLTEEGLAFRQYKIQDCIKLRNQNIKEYKGFMKMSHLNRALYNSSHKTVLPTILRNYDRYSMANGVEIRMPFMDYRIVTFAFAIEWQSKIHNGYSKSIIRDSLEDIMPQSIVRRKNKIGFNTPILEWIKGPWKEWITDEISSNEFKDSEFVDSRDVTERVGSIINNENATYQQASDAWTAFMPFLWEKYFYKRATGTV